MMSRRTFLTRGVILAGSLLALPGAGYGYSTRVEPRWLEVVRLKLRLEGLPAPFRGLRILQFSDVHLGFHYDADRLAGLAARIEKERPDVVCFTGDLVDYAVGSAYTPIRDALRLIRAPLGSYAVLGNHDYYGDADEVAALLKEGGFTCLRNRMVRLEREGAVLCMAGVEDAWEGKPDLKRALQDAGTGDFTVLLSHAPDYADEVLAYPVQLQLSGHSHGGQVRLPLIGPLASVPYGKKYPSGRYDLGGGKLVLYTNRGIGVSVKPVRFLCRPELTVITLE
ncbi:metallophosphoesterase [Gorillibacterium sp. sgz5001074]|uniref:metallophosphoesterase n=1 Tax=Gorillibacterium sp. sgz5001074 TaxID=3446695 RepID=UPI003F6685FC